MYLSGLCCIGGDRKTADWGYVRLYDYRPKSVSAGLAAAEIVGMPALSVTTAPLRRHMRQLWRYVNKVYLYLLPFYCVLAIVIMRLTHHSSLSMFSVCQLCRL